jgi:hypothetical protein
MNTQTTHSSPLESVRVLWSTTDEQSFRIAAELVTPAFAFGAGVLLASYDPEPLPPDPRPSTPAAPAARSASAATAARR